MPSLMPQISVLLNYLDHTIHDFGATIIESRGRRWKRIKMCSRGLISLKLMEDNTILCVFVFWQISKEQIAPNTVATPNIGAKNIDHLIIPVIMQSSPISFGRGGRPSFAAHLINHQKGKSTVIILNPRVIKIFRVCVRSYKILARANKAEETNP